MRKFFYLAVLVLSTAFSGCQFMDRTVTGNGNIITEKRSVSGFDKVSTAGSIDVLVRPAASFSVTIEGDENLMRYIHLDKEGRKLRIKVARGYNLRSAHGVKVTIGMPNVEALYSAGSGSIKAEGTFRTSGRLELDVAGSGRIEGDFDAPEIEADIAGSGSLVLTGRTRDVDVDIAGSGDFRGNDLLSENVKISIAGSGSAFVYASLNLKVSVAGSGDVVYRGQPMITKSVAGSGTVRAADGQ